MPRHMAIQTAHARMVQDPLTFTLDDDAEPYTVDPSIDIGTLGAMFAGMGDRAKAPDGASIQERRAVAEKARGEAIFGIRMALVETDRDRFDVNQHRLDSVRAAEIIGWILSEVSGQEHPTSQP